MLTHKTQRKIFLISFILFLGVRYVLSAGKVVSFDFFKVRSLNQNIKVGEQYVRQHLVDDAMVGTVIAQIGFGENRYNAETLSADALSLFEQSQVLVGIDVLELITTADNPEQALNLHLAHVEATLEQISKVRDGLKAKSQEYQDIANNCLVEKRVGDQLFFDGVQELDQSKATEGLDKSLLKGPCYMTNRIYANAYAYLADRVSTNYAILAKRRELLVRDSQLLLQHTAYLETGLLDQLYKLQRDLSSVNQVEYNQFQGVFDFTFPYDITALPQYQKIFFDDDEVPTYLDPAIEY